MIKGDLTLEEYHFVTHVERILGDVGMLPGLSPHVTLKLARDKIVKDGRFYIQAVCERMDIYTQEQGQGQGGKAYLSPHMVESEIVQLCFGLILRYFEHEVREHFTYQGKAIFGPHISVQALLRAADHLAFREEPPT